MFNHELPDLSAIPRTHWREALKPLNERQRRLAVKSLSDQADIVEAMTLVGFMVAEDPPVSRDIPVPEVVAGAPVAKAPASTRVVSFRISADEYDRVASLAARLHLKPTTLARLMVIRGVDASLREQAARGA